ncbi:methionine--tRNA ligase [Intestinimonas sp. MSJ-38]|uniref:methionine--tRNA ligase n=1 Tax=Intestinimonas sp. MSJ-38 TaxID=2841532 RepID=UPI001C0FEEAE|nr:methionine--tRNA ligase [Intestinimonas sp. MSJ-38]MBU5431197.1 methionine--tRNA ligase [Intestinimonas sp. MSJ-38]
MNSKGKYYLTTAIAYTSGKPHVGNTYEIVLADAIARYKRKDGYDVLFQTGTDEHGQKIQEKAEKAGMTPQAFVDEMAAEVRRNWDVLHTSYDRFIRTTDPMHEKKVQQIFKRLYDQGDIYKGSYEGWYCTPCESFFTESQLKDGKCPDCGAPVQKAKEEAYFFRMSKYADRLMQYIEDHPDFIQPESRKNEMVNNFLKPGLQDLCVSRTSFSWGIPVEFDPGHVVYVWLDALTNYITFLGYEPEGESTEEYKKFWPADVHLIGKDILRFHTIYWPIFLMALGEELPHQVFGHPWLLVGEGKMSKSKGNVIYADHLVELFGVDAVRYYLLHEMPFANDGTITYELLIERTNSDLANILGNLVNRTVTMCHRYQNGVMGSHDVCEPVDEELKQVCLEAPEKVRRAMDQLKVGDAIDEVFAIFRRANKYIDETMPWVLGKDESKKGRLDTVLYNLLESIRFGAVLLEAFLPDAAQKIFAQLNTDKTCFDSLSSFGALPEGHQVGQAEILFARMDAEKKLEEVAVFQAAHAPQEEKKEPLPPHEPKDTIVYDDFAKVELTVAKVLHCEKVKKSKKLLRFELDLGYEKRQVLSGIAQWYEPEDLIGHNVVVVSNLAPRKMMGLDSCGMILSATCGENDVRVVLADGAVPGAHLS